MKGFKLARGFTLAEALVSLLLTAFLLIMILSIYLIAQKAYAQNDIRSELMQNGRTVLDRMERELRQASDIATVIPPNDSDPSLIPHEIQFQDGHDTSNIHYIRYYLADHSLRRQLIRYYFISGIYTRYDALDELNNPPQKEVYDDNLVAEYVSEINFYGDPIIYIWLELSNNDKKINLLTGFYARNL